MLTLTDGRPQLACARRDFLRLGGGLAVAGFTLPSAAVGPFAQAAAAAPPAGGTVFGRAKSCIFIYLLGGPPHLDMFDLKPEAPAEYRGPFRPIATKVPGVQICQHLPRLAGIADRYALLRSVSHHNSNH